MSVYEKKELISQSFFQKLFKFFNPLNKFENNQIQVIKVEKEYNVM